MQARQHVMAGGTLAEPLKTTPVFPAMVVHMIIVGENTGALDEMLNKIADFYDDEVDAAVTALTSLLEPMMIVFLGVSVGGIVVAMYLPIFKMVTLDQVARHRARARMKLADSNALLRAFGLARLGVAAAPAGGGARCSPEELMPGDQPRHPRPRPARRRAAARARCSAFAAARPAAPRRLADLPARHRAHHGGGRGHRRRRARSSPSSTCCRSPPRACCSRAPAASPSRRVSSALYTGLVFGAHRASR